MIIGPVPIFSLIVLNINFRGGLDNINMRDGDHAENAGNGLQDNILENFYHEKEMLIILKKSLLTKMRKLPTNITTNTMLKRW